MAARPEHAETIPGHYQPERTTGSSVSGETLHSNGHRRGATPAEKRVAWIHTLLSTMRPQPSLAHTREPKPLPLAPSLIDQLHRQQETKTSAHVMVCDVDGTIYSNLSLRSLLHARKVNRQTAQMLKTHHIPIIANSGARFAQFKMWALGFPTPDVIITEFGTRIKYKTRIPFVYRTAEKNGRARLTRVKNSPEVVMQQRMVSLARPGYRVVRNESIRGTNTTDAYSGTIAVIPESAGKDNALRRVLEATALAHGKPLVAHVFGDSLGDEGIISLPPTEHVSIYGHGVGPKPLLRKALLTRGAQEVRSGLYHQHFQTGPVIHRGNAPDAIQEVVRDMTDHVSSAKNSMVRQIIHPVAAFLNKLNLFTRHTAPNTITVNGFKKVTSATEHLHTLSHDGKYHPILATRERIRLLTGSLDDYLDGLQAERLAGKRQPEEAALGPYLDPLTDRAREIHALGLRAKDRLQTNPPDAVTTYKAMIATVMPSLARSFVEAATGNTVPETSEGSALARNKLLLASANAEIQGHPQESLALDRTLLIDGMKTFAQRQTLAVDSFNTPIDAATFIARGVEQDTTRPQQTKFRNTAFMRMGMNVGILQQLDGAIRKALTQYPSQLAEYEQFMRLSGVQNYVALDNRHFPTLDARLQLSKFLQLEGDHLFAVQSQLPNVA